ncbi:hypothetical protein AgCh_011637 [Apium graveolens]
MLAVEDWRCRYEEAEKEAEKGLTLLLEWGSPWDKRMSWEGWIAWARVLLMKAKKKSWPQTSWCILNLGLIVAVKQLDINGYQRNREFLAEVLTLSIVHHPNLVNLLGYCADGQQRILVYEYMPNGSLENHLVDNEKKQLYDCKNVQSLQSSFSFGKGEFRQVERLFGIRLKHSKSPFVQLDIEAPICEQLANLSIIEYPVIYIFLPSHHYDFEVTKVEIRHKLDHKEFIKNGEPSPKGVLLREEVIKEEKPADTLDSSSCATASEQDGTKNDIFFDKALDEQLDFTVNSTVAEIIEKLDPELVQGLLGSISDLISE